ncbi:MAG TPA: peptidylprolyl isomerase, partial [Ktedonobacteraceae bacterium]|nr:peptidylprolyl isomerase [Ktedonobacteraceae bacterium]
LEVNKLYGPQGLTAQVQNLQKQDKAALDSSNTLGTQIDSLNKQIKALPSGSSQQRTNLENQLKTVQKQLADAQAKHASLSGQINNLNQNTIPLERQSFTESQVGNDSATWLQDDELIREWLTTQSTAIQNKINPSATQITNALRDFKANIPTSSSYNSFLSQMGISNDDVVQMMTLNLRRQNMQNYLASLTVSPAYQVLARTMTIDTLANANKILKQLQKGADFGKIAKQKSVDSATASSGGSLGWLARGQEAQSDSSGVVDNWLFDPARILNQISPVLVENGAYRFLQILNIDPSRTIDASTLQSLTSNALNNWLLEVKALPTTKITPIDQNMLLDPNNLPPTSVLPSGAPATTPVPGAPGSTGGP